MIYRNEISEVNHMSTNNILNKQRLQKYKAHLNKISQIENRTFNPKHQAKVREQKIIELTKLKEFARNFRAKEDELQRSKKDLKMMKNIKERSHTSIFGQEKLIRTASSIKFNSRIVGSSKSMKKIKMNLPYEVSNQNRRIVKSIIEKSYLDQSKLRKTLRSSTKDYIKIREHMRRIKGQRSSLKKLKTEPIHYQDIDSSTKNITELMNEEDIKEIITKLNKISDTMNPKLSSRQKIRANQNLAEMDNKKILSKQKQSKKLFALRQSLSEIIRKKL